MASDYRKFQQIDKRINELELEKVNESDGGKMVLIWEELEILKEIHDSRQVIEKEEEKPSTGEEEIKKIDKVAK